MRLWCWYCHKSVSSELPNDALFRAIAICPECIEESPEANNHPLTHTVDYAILEKSIKRYEEMFGLCNDYRKERDALRKQLDESITIIKHILHGDDVREDDYVSLHYAIEDARVFISRLKE